MTLTSLSLHALRALAYLARHEGGGFVPVDAIADAEGLRTPFLAKALGELAAARVVIASRGPGGGYRLARPAGTITLLEVVEAVEGRVGWKAPRVGNDAQVDDGVQEVCDDVTAAVRARLRQVSVAELAGAE
jgi:Rrf2 family protein